MMKRKYFKGMQIANTIFLFAAFACSAEEESVVAKSADATAEETEALTQADDAFAAQRKGIEQRLDLSHSNFDVARASISTASLSKEPDVARLINDIDFVSAKIAQSKLAGIGREDIMINTDNEKGEPAIMTRNDDGLFSVDNRVIPTPRPYKESRAMAEKDTEDRMIRDDVARRMRSLGVTDVKEYDVDLGSVVATQLTRDSGEVIRHEYERVARVYRKFNGIPVSNKIVFSYDVDLNLRKVKGRWNKINVQKSRLTTADSTETLQKKVVDGLVARGVDPSFERKISVRPFYVVEKDRDGDFVMSLKMAAKVPVSNGEKGQASGEILDIEI